MIIPKYDGTQKYTDEVDELRAISGHMLGASGVQIPQNILDNLQSIREEDGTSETINPQDCLGSLVLEVLDSTILALLLDPTDLDAFGFPLYTLSAGDYVITGVIAVSLRGTSLVALALVVVFTLVEVNKGLLESLVLRESVCLVMLLEDMIGSTNLTFLSFFTGVTATSFLIGFVKLGHVLET
ncbi:hypothetical protein Tco_0400700 [Tanacetum coccineum]